MLQPGGEADLALEALGPERGGQLGVEHLERHRPVVPEVLGEIDRGHAAAPELALERVAVGQALAQSCSGSPMRMLPAARQVVPSTSFSNRGLFRSGSNVGSIRSQPGDR